ncbi:ABC transporter permease [Stappia sp.]|uniref:ABC transporter permease n=1 Tax=Stappia sp. TaxID=1870903 RepID=UPI003D1203D0
MSITDLARPRRRPSHGLAVGLALAGLLAVSSLAPFWLPLPDPNRQDLMAVLVPPGAGHLLGTDHLGRDILSRVLHGAPRSLGIALACVASTAVLGVLLGLAAALGGRFSDTLIMRLADLVLAFPGLLLALLLAGLTGGGLLPMAIGIQIALWPLFARMARANARVALQETHVEAARLAGFSSGHILRHHLLPPVLRQTVSLAALGVGSAILTISSLGFLGLGLEPPTPEWGAMIGELLPYAPEAPVQILAPCLAIVASVFAFTLVGESIAAHLAGGQE